MPLFLEKASNKLKQFSKNNVGLVLFILIFAGIGGYFILSSHADSPSGCAAGDLNQDGIVNVFDLSILLSHWGQSGDTQCQGDINQDGVVNIFDLSIQLSNWGQTVGGGGSPVNSALPSISGTDTEGDTLTATTGTWSNSPTSYSYQWQDCANSSCSNINGATSSTYTVQSSDVGDAIDVVVTATNGSGSASATSGQTGTVADALTCNLNATPSNISTEVAAATPGQVVCLASGDYSSFTGTSKSAPGITITSAPGATVTFNSGITLNLSNVQNFTLDGTGGGGTMSIGGQLDMETSGDALLSKALNLTFQNIAFAPGSEVFFDGPENSNVTFNRDTFSDANAACSNGNPTGITEQFILPYTTATATTPTGLTVENSVFVAPGDLWNPDRAIQTAAPLTTENNVFAGYTDHLDAGSCNHIDSEQDYAGTNNPSSAGTFIGNLCYDDYGCFMAFDGTSDNTITDNVCFDMESACINLYADSGSVVNHNVQETGGADPSGCAYEPQTQSCNSSILFVNSNKSGDTVPNNETYTNNISSSGPNVEGGSITTYTNNLWSGASSPNINGVPTFVGGTNPITWAGFELTTGSTGHAGGSDGLDVGIRASAGGPPTGGGSAPVNTATPSVSGTHTEGDTLTTTNGTWTITGNVPTVTTYQWWDCPSASFSTSSCTPIQPETAPLSANSQTYTLQSSDVGDYVFSEVTVTNANGQVNAVSSATGQVSS